MSGCAGRALRAVDRAETVTLARLADLERASAEVLAVHRMEGSRGIGARHFQKAESLRRTGGLVGHERKRFDLSVRRKGVVNGFRGGGEWQIANIKFGQVELPGLEMNGCAACGGTRSGWRKDQGRVQATLVAEQACDFRLESGEQTFRRLGINSLPCACWDGLGPFPTTFNASWRGHPRNRAGAGIFRARSAPPSRHPRSCLSGGFRRVRRTRARADRSSNRGASPHRS